MRDVSVIYLAFNPVLKMYTFIYQGLKGSGGQEGFEEAKTLQKKVNEMSLIHLI